MSLPESVEAKSDAPRAGAFDVLKAADLLVDVLVGQCRVDIQPLVALIAMPGFVGYAGVSSGDVSSHQQGAVHGRS